MKVKGVQVRDDEEPICSNCREALSTHVKLEVERHADNHVETGKLIDVTVVHLCPNAVFKAIERNKV